MASTTVTIRVYLDDSRIFKYETSGKTPAERAAKARDHIHAMQRQGLVVGPTKGELEFIPPHRIAKMKATGDFQASNYQGTWEGA